MTFISTIAWADNFSPNASTPLGPGYHLDANTLAQGAIDPCWFIGMTSSDGPTLQTLDLTDPAHPRLTSNLVVSPAPGALENFSIFVGMINPPSSVPQFSFNLPATGLNSDNNYSFSATADSGQNFTSTFHINAVDGSVTRWSQTSPPVGAPGMSSFQINFTIQPPATAVGDPILTFGLDEIVNQQTDPLQFSMEGSETPEPATFILLGSGIGGLYSLRKRNRY